MNFHFPQQEWIDQQNGKGSAKMDHLRRRYEEENSRQLQKIRDMRDELLWYKVSRIERSERTINWGPLTIL